MAEKIPEQLRDYIRQRDERLARRADTLWDLSDPIHARQTRPDANENGRSHCQMVENYLWHLITETGNQEEFCPLDLFLLSCCACCHDFDKGLASFLPDCPPHGEGSGAFVVKHAQKLIVSPPEATAIDYIVGVHNYKGDEYQQKLQELPEEYATPSGTLNLQRLAVLLKAADTLHTDNSRISDLAVDVNQLRGYDRAKHLARQCIYGWRRDGTRIILDAFPKSSEQMQALLDSEQYIQKNEWAPIARELRGYGFPHDLHFNINKKYMPRPTPPSASKWARLDMARAKSKTPIAKPSRPPTIYTNLPSTSPDLFGRTGKLSTLRNAWQDGRTNILTIIAWGGVGKTALVNFWLSQMARQNYLGAERVFGWSFYSQGTREDRQASSDTFLADTLKWFGDEETAESAKSPWNKGVRLAELIREQKTLLILDGVEPLQYPPGPMAGRLKDQGLQGLLRELSRGMDGLCIITTREDIKDLEHCVGHTVKRVELEHLSPEAGAQLLKKFQVTDTKDGELEKASAECRGHALALTLLGSYLKTLHDGDIRKRDKIPRLLAEQKQGAHARRVMASYENWFEDKPELNILYIIGLFDRPADLGAVDTVKTDPPIEGLTDKLISLSDADYKFALQHLRDLRLLDPQDPANPDTLDAHPLVREYFGDKLKSSRPDAWTEAHGRLYEYYKSVPEKEQPDTIEEMESLFRAVYHGCAAGKHQKTLDDVFFSRLDRGEAYVGRKLGAFSSIIAALSGFFAQPWGSVVAEIRGKDKAYLMNVTGFCLRALGRLREAAEPMEGSLQRRIKLEDWVEAALDAGNLSELHLTLGEVEKAVEYGHRSVEYADKSGNWEKCCTMRTTLADAVHQAGKVEEAKRLFEEAEGMQKERQTEYEYLYSMQGYQYCDLLLALGECAAVKERIKKCFEWRLPSDSLLGIALENLSLGRAEIEKVKSEKAKGKSREKDLIEAKKWLDEAVDGLRKAGEQIWIAKGLLARAELYRYKQNWERVWGDLEEVWEIAERGEMKLHLADYHLESARVCLDEGRKGDAKGHDEEAKRLIRSCGYHRRDGELKDIEGRTPKRGK